MAESRPDALCEGFIRPDNVLSVIYSEAGEWEESAQLRPRPPKAILEGVPEERPEPHKVRTEEEDERPEEEPQILTCQTVVEPRATTEEERPEGEEEEEDPEGEFGLKGSQATLIPRTVSGISNLSVETEIFESLPAGLQGSPAEEETAEPVDLQSAAEVFGVQDSDESLSAPVGVDSRKTYITTGLSLHQQQKKAEDKPKTSRGDARGPGVNRSFLKAAGHGKKGPPERKAREHIAEVEADKAPATPRGIPAELVDGLKRPAAEKDLVPEEWRLALVERLRELVAANAEEKARVAALRAENEELRSMQAVVEIGKDKNVRPNSGRCLRAETAESRVETLRQKTAKLEQKLFEARELHQSRLKHTRE